MGLTTAQERAFQQLKAKSSSAQAVTITDNDIRYLVRRTAVDLGLGHHFHADKISTPEFFTVTDTPHTDSPDDPKAEFARLLELNPDADSYVACLAAIFKGRAKYRRVLETQPLANMDQVGPRGLLQYGVVATEALASLLVWRKWIYDIDNRAAQDTGYFIEPVLAGAIGGCPAPARVSPVKRSSNPSKGRQVDCIKDDKAYEFKLRMTIAASGQGRWTEEVDFASDCRESGYTPILLVLDPTESSKLTILKDTFERAGGNCYTGQDAWDHLKAEASDAMVLFIERYVEEPLKEIYAAGSESRLPAFSLEDEGERVRFRIGDVSWAIDRRIDQNAPIEIEYIPEDAREALPGI